MHGDVLFAHGVCLLPTDARLFLLPWWLSCGVHGFSLAFCRSFRNSGKQWRFSLFALCSFIEWNQVFCICHVLPSGKMAYKNRRGSPLQRFLSVFHVIIIAQVEGSIKVQLLFQTHFFECGVMQSFGLACRYVQPFIDLFPFQAVHIPQPQQLSCAAESCAGS